MNLDTFFKTVLPAQIDKSYGQDGFFKITKSVDGVYVTTNHNVRFLLTNYIPRDTTSGIDLNGTIIEVYNVDRSYDFMRELTSDFVESIVLTYNDTEYSVTIPKNQNDLSYVIQMIIEPLNYGGN